MSLKRKPPSGNVRRVASIERNQRGVITNKAGRTVQFESFQEHVKTLVLERDRSVVDYQSQPVVFSFEDEDKKPRTYIPDFMVWKQDGTKEIHEVTLTRRQKELRIRRREAEASRICQENNWRYVIDTEKTLPQQTEVANLLGLYRYRSRIYENASVVRAASDVLCTQAPLPLQELKVRVASQLALPEQTVFTSLCHLLWHDMLSTDFQTLFVRDGAISSKILVWFTQQEGE